MKDVKNLVINTWEEVRPARWDYLKLELVLLLLSFVVIFFPITRKMTPLVALFSFTQMMGMLFIAKKVREERSFQFKDFFSYWNVHWQKLILFFLIFLVSEYAFNFLWYIFALLIKGEAFLFTLSGHILFVLISAFNYYLCFVFFMSIVEKYSLKNSAQKVLKNLSLNSFTFSLLLIGPLVLNFFGNLSYKESWDVIMVGFIILGVSGYFLIPFFAYLPYRFYEGRLNK